MLGILTVNTGTPDAPTAGAVRRFLKLFLADTRVVELPRLLWLPLLRGVILPLRAPRSARNYQRVWMAEGSPLAVYSRQLRSALELELRRQLGDRVAIESAFLYSSPQIAECLRRLRAAGALDIVVLPLFPQTSGTTTGAVYDQVADALRAWRELPTLRLVSDYHADPGYIKALGASVREHWEQQGRRTHLLLSFHGIPERCVQRGDPYECHCRTTAELLAAELGLDAAAWTLSFQSRFGKARWLLPATDRTLADLPARGVRDLTLLCPGFAVDCLETLEEIAIGGREIFMHAGGEHFHYVPALNGRADHAAALAHICLRSR
jgi:protoporphyrin/coproporphyrin ferrochelatase